MTTTSPTACPTIETGRLRLRAHRLDDLAARIAITQDAETTRFIGGPQSPEDNWSRLLRYAGHWTMLGYGLFALEECSSGRLIGEIGLGDFHRGLGEDFDPFPEAAWMLANWAAGAGYATEAISAVMAWHGRSFGAARTVCIIAPDNAPSLRLAAKLGFTSYREATYKDHPVILHERPGPLPKSQEPR